MGDALRWLLGGDPSVARLSDAVVKAAARRPQIPEFATVAALGAAFPRDPGVLIALLMNHVRVAPGAAVFVPHGTLHAYLRGTAIEIMASSDNVLRAGLTAKHVDAPERLHVVDSNAAPVHWVRPHRVGPVTAYRPPVGEFDLAQASLTDEALWIRVPVAGTRLILVLRGRLEATAGPPLARGERPQILTRGQAAFVSADVGPVALRSVACAVIAGVPATDHP